ncbi:MAG: hypothetical protein ACLFOY_15010 [Desulfatibacillaceae bacterium]
MEVKEQTGRVAECVYDALCAEKALSGPEAEALAAFCGGDEAEAAACVADPDREGHEVVVEAVLFPDSVEMEAVERILRGRSLGLAGVLEVVHRVLGRAPVARFVLGPGGPVAELALDTDAIRSHVARLRLDRDLPRDLVETLSRLEGFSAKTLACLRHAGMDFTPARTEFFRTLAERNRQDPARLAGLVETACRVLPDIVPTRDPVRGLEILHEWCAHHLARDRLNQERFSGMNMETRLQSGVRLAYVDEGRLTRRMEQAARLLYAATGRMPLPEGPLEAEFEVDATLAGMMERMGPEGDGE